MNITVNRKKRAQSRSPFDISTPYDTRYGFWGVVTEVHPEDCTVHIRMDNGQIITGVRVASMEWVTVVKDRHLTGERHLPPVDTFVFCLMPNGEISSAFVLCSGFARQEAVHGDFKQKGQADVHDRVDNSGWEYTSNYKTGTKTLKNKVKDETVSITADQESGEEKIIVRIHGNEITADANGIGISTDGKIDIHADGDTAISISGNATVEAQNITIKSSVKTEIKGGQVVLGGSVAPTGTGALCALPACIFSGAPHTGNTAANA